MLANTQPIPFVNIWVKNGSSWEQLLMKTERLRLPCKTNDTLVLSAVGFEMREIRVGNP